MDAQKQREITIAILTLCGEIRDVFGITHPDDSQVSIIIKGSGVEITDRESGIVCDDGTPPSIAAHKFIEMIQEAE